MTPFLSEPRLNALAGIRHGFFGREGGTSAGIYASLNCGLGSNDEPGQVAENRGRVAEALGVAPGHLVTPYQVHGIQTIVVEAPWPADARPHADALVTNGPGIAIGIGTADCGPVLLADPQAGVIGAAHAGWKGALAGILELAISAMETLGARRERITATLGPTISQANYEVGPELVANFLAASAGNQRFFEPSPRPGHALFDLPGYIVERLTRAGVNAASVGLCTYADGARFYSFRRATHRGETDYGRELSVIRLAQ